MGYTVPHDDEAFSVVTSDVALSYAGAIRDTGLTSSISDLVELQDYGVVPVYLKTIEADDPISPSRLSTVYKGLKAADSMVSIEEN